MKLDPVIARETRFIALGTLVLSLIQQAVFLAIGKWWLGVLFANLMVGAVGILHFFLLGLTVQKAIRIEDEKARAQLMKSSQMARMLLPAAALVLGALIPTAFDFWALLPPLLFNRLTLLVRGVMLARKGDATPTAADTPEGDDTEEGGEL